MTNHTRLNVIVTLQVIGLLIGVIGVLLGIIAWGETIVVPHPVVWMGIILGVVGLAIFVGPIFLVVMRRIE
jgi:drug/metabolite transporter (DMT)-like permease